MNDRWDLKGQKFGRWTVMSYAGSAGKKGSKKRLWLCRCDCGNERVVQGHNLKNGKTNSCGCLRKVLSLRRGVACV